MENTNLSYTEVAYLLSEPIHIHKSNFEAFLGKNPMRELSTKELQGICPKLKSIDKRYDGGCLILFNLKSLKKIVKEKELNKKSNVRKGALSGIALKMCEKFLDKEFIDSINESLSTKKEYVKNNVPVKRMTRKPKNTKPPTLDI